MTMVAMAGLLGLTAACGSAGDDDASTTTTSAATGAAGPTEPGTAKPAQKADTAVAGTGMKGGCDAVHKVFAALEAGDKAAAQTLKDKGEALFDDVAATSATGDLNVAVDGATMASDLGFSLPEGPIYKSTLAEDYGSICVAKYGATALPG